MVCFLQGGGPGDVCTRGFGLPSGCNLLCSSLFRLLRAASAIACGSPSGELPDKTERPGLGGVGCGVWPGLELSSGVRRARGWRVDPEASRQISGSGLKPASGAFPVST